MWLAKILWRFDRAEIVGKFWQGDVLTHILRLDYGSSLEIIIASSSGLSYGT